MSYKVYYTYLNSFVNIMSTDSDVVVLGDDGSMPDTPPLLPQPSPYLLPPSDLTLSPPVSTPTPVISPNLLALPLASIPEKDEPGIFYHINNKVAPVEEKKSQPVRPQKRVRIRVPRRPPTPPARVTLAEQARRAVTAATLIMFEQLSAVMPLAIEDITAYIKAAANQRLRYARVSWQYIIVLTSGVDKIDPINQSLILGERIRQHFSEEGFAIELSVSGIELNW